MNLQGQKRGLSQNKINNYHYLNGKRNTTVRSTSTSTINAATEGIMPNKTVINNNYTVVSEVMNQDDNCFKPLSSISKSMGFSPSIPTKIKYHMEEDENNKSSLGLFQQISNANLNRSHNMHLIKQNEAASGAVNLTLGNSLNNNSNISNDFKEKTQLSGLNINHCNSGISSNNNNDSKKKRSRVIYCHVCCQYKPRSTRARFQVCQHIACYDCVRLALMIQQRYNVKAHCPFCQIELDWNKVKPFIVLFKPKPEVNIVDEGSKTTLDSQGMNVGSCTNNSLGVTNNNNNIQNSVINVGKHESNNNINSQIISNDLIAQAFECNGVSKEKILRGFFSCYLQKQMQIRSSGCILQNNKNNNTGISQNMYDSNEFQNVCTSFSGILDPYKPSSVYYGGENNNKQYISLQNFADQNNLVFPNLPNSSESSCGEFLPDVVLAPIGEALPLVNCMHPTVTAKKFNPCMYGGSFRPTISNNGGSNNITGHNTNISNINVHIGNSHNNNNSNCNSSSNSSISSNSSNSSISSIESNINNHNNNNTMRNSKFSINSIGGVKAVVHGVSCNCSSCLQQGGRTGIVSSMGLRIIPPGGILSKIYDENNPRGFACGLFNPSIPTDGVVLMQQGKSNKNQHIHFELQKQFIADNLDNYSINNIDGGIISINNNTNNNNNNNNNNINSNNSTGNNICTGMNTSNSNNNQYGQQNNYIQSQNHTQMSCLIYGHSCGGSSTNTSINVGNPLLNCEDAISNSITSYGVYNDENIRSSTGVPEILGFFETNEDKQMPSWMITTPCLNMKDILSDWRNSTLLKSHSDMVICSI
ncbi:uncharacterized protein cubi_00094 [Cryptosporidium ubiquitum]|uniref:RING-type domain-containing protein n=1 Tax=Cryptosporidium ubiquitum TaxID=857276 RepID=A0A1J4MNU1_9CRYT|nr:uncharacterized protein cubi_00094 [Cryptosporidium ubiquitum]OII74541.1 hypothetical protein cubi_00094 [Cryptosporidium ubiquitum]